MIKLGRNDPCPCGSGKKYKHCCFGKETSGSAIARADAMRMTRALQIAVENYELGNALFTQGRVAEAAAIYRKAIAARPDLAEPHNNLGNALRNLGQMDEAVASYRRALSAQPDFAAAHCNLGIALKDRGNLDEAIGCFRQALLENPNFAEAYSNLGNALSEQGKMDEAIASYRLALSAKPNFAAAHFNLGNALKAQGKLHEAIGSYIRALHLGETDVVKLWFAQCLRNIHFIQATPEIQLLVDRAIAEAWSRPNDLLNAGKSLLLLNQGVRECIDRAANAWPRRLSKQELFGISGLDQVVDAPLFKNLLENVAISGIEFERFLTMARTIMLESAMAEDRPNATVVATSHATGEDKLLAFYCSLARQCFINEYVYAISKEELTQAQSLRQRIIHLMTGNSPVPAIWLVAMAAYFPLTSLPSAGNLFSDRTWPDPVAALLVQQIREPLAEREYRVQIPRLTAIDDGVSRLVQEQYEEHPYPRWMKAPFAAHVSTVDAYLHREFPHSPIRSLGKDDEIEVLIAGCGTGQQSIDTARQFRGAKVLAVDLSLTSLAYAKRKSDELGLKNIEYAQADILRLGTIGRTFDVIESVGVLHHLADPMAGWRVLLQLLRPDGFMHLGFYSEIARQEVVAGRSFIAQGGYTANAEDIRQCRQELMTETNAGQFRQLLSWADFYGMSVCRDLLFHVEEHRYTLRQLKRMLETLGLTFIGFEQQEESISRQYLARFPDDQAKTNLENWHMFESENPDTFVSMYQFWIQNRV